MSLRFGSGSAKDGHFAGADVVFAFGDHQLDLDRRELRRGYELVELEPQVFDLLVYLIRERHRVVSKDDLLRAVWGSRIVSDSALTTRIHAARRALGDDGAAQQLIRTFSRKGVRFVGNVREMPEPPTGNAEAGASALYLQQALCDPPSIVVLPFADLSDDHRLDDFVHGLAEETTMALCRIRWLHVTTLGPNVFRKRALDAAHVNRPPEMRYRLQGSIRKNGGRVRVIARLTEAETGVHLWSDRLDGSLEDPLGFQDKVASGIAGAIEPVLQACEAARVQRLPMNDLTPYHVYLRAHAMHSVAARQVPAALALLDETIARDPNYGPALGLAANCCMRLCMDGISTNPAADAGKAADYAWRALQVAPDDPGVLANVARPLAYAGENISMTIRLMDRALEINPNFARGWYIRGFLKYWAGDLEVAIDEIETARQLSPRGRFGTALTAISNALVFGERFEEAIAKLQLAVLEDPSFPPNYRMLAICYAHLGQLDAARAALARLPGTVPLILPNLARSYRAMARVSDHHKLALSGIRRATGVKA